MATEASTSSSSSSTPSATENFYLKDNDEPAAAVVPKQPPVKRAYTEVPAAAPGTVDFPTDHQRMIGRYLTKLDHPTKYVKRTISDRFYVSVSIAWMIALNAYVWPIIA